MLLNKKLATAIATGAILMNALSGVAFADTSAVVAGNGADSLNNVTVDTNHTVTAVQNNHADVKNDISANANTGGNNANFNTGGGSTILTGGASNSVEVVNKLNSNKLDLGDCACNKDNLTAIVDQNGAFSANEVNVDSTRNTDVFQTNNAYVYNKVDAHAKTGDNNSNFGTGGDSLILTGPASNAVGVATIANQNIADLGSHGSSNNGLGTVARIGGNGAFSNNDIDLSKEHNVLVDQFNDANIRNSVKTGAETGDNSSNDLTNGSSRIQTGSARNWTGVQNLANSNWVDLGNCGCTSNDGLFKILENGAFSNSDIDANLRDNKSLFETNHADLDNHVKSHADTGDNSQDFGTGSVFFGSDPVTLTGNAQSKTIVSNQTNSNVASSGMSFELGNWSWNVSFDPFSLWNSNSM